MSSRTTKPPALLNDGFSLVGVLSRVPTADDLVTLANLLKRGIADNILGATRSDLSYLEALSLAYEGELLESSPTKETVMRFIAYYH